MSKLNHALLIETSVHSALKSAGLSIEGTLAECGDRLFDYFQKNTPQEALVVCDKCFGESSPDLDQCPFCLDGAAEKAAEQPATKRAAAEAEADEAKEADEKAKKAAEKEAAKAAKAAEKAAKKEQSLVKVEPHKAEIVQYTEEQLDAAIGKVFAAKSKAALGYWELGVEIKSIYDTSIYKARSDEKGKPKYVSFDQFCTAELGISSVQARRLMNVATRWDQATVAKFGTTKLSLVLEAPEEDQDEIVEKVVEKGGSAKDVSDAVAASRAKRGRGAKGKGTKRPDIAEKNAKRAPKKRASKASASDFTGSRTVKLYCKAKPDQRAKRLASSPVGEEIINGVKIKIEVCEDLGGELVVKMKFSQVAE